MKRCLPLLTGVAVFLVLLLRPSKLGVCPSGNGDDAAVPEEHLGRRTAAGKSPAE